MYSSCVLWVQCICILAVYCGTVTMYSGSVLWVQRIYIYIYIYIYILVVYCGYSDYLF